MLCFGNGLSPVIITVCFGFRTSVVFSMFTSRGKKMVEAAKKNNVAPLQQRGMFCGVIFLQHFLLMLCVTHGSLTHESIDTLLVSVNQCNQWIMCMFGVC